MMVTTDHYLLLLPLLLLLLVMMVTTDQYLSVLSYVTASLDTLGCILDVFYACKWMDVVGGMLCKSYKPYIIIIIY